MPDPTNPNFNNTVPSNIPNKPTKPDTPSGDKIKNQTIPSGTGNATIPSGAGNATIPSGAGNSTIPSGAGNIPSGNGNATIPSGTPDRVSNTTKPSRGGSDDDDEPSPIDIGDDDNTPTTPTTPTDEPMQYRFCSFEFSTDVEAVEDTLNTLTTK